MAKTKRKTSRKVKEDKRNKARQRRAIAKQKTPKVSQSSSSSFDDSSASSVESPAKASEIPEDLPRQARQAGKKGKDVVAKVKNKQLQDEEEVKESILDQDAAIQKFEKLRNLVKNSNKKATAAVNELQETVTGLYAKVEQMNQQLQCLPKLQSDLAFIKDMLVSVVKQQQLPQSTYTFPTQEANEILLGLVLKNWAEIAPSVKIDQDLLKQQVLHMTEASELETLRRHSTMKEFWSYLTQLYYPQMAVRICMMHVSQRSKRSISNNLNSYKFIGSICQSKGFEYLDFGRMMQVEQFVKDRAYEELRKLSTIDLYLRHLSQLVRQVYGVKEYTARVESQERPPPNFVVSVEDLQLVIDWLRKQPSELDQLFGFCLYLMLITAARNKTIRTLEFAAFHDDIVKKQHVYSFYIKETKTKKSKGFFITKQVYDYVQRLQAQRFVWAEEQKLRMVDLDEEQRQKLMKLIDRRTKYIFTFFTQSAIQYHIDNLRTRNFPKKIEFMQSFILHGIRKARIQQAYKQNPDKARELADHSKLSVTEHYLGYVEADLNIVWQAPAVVDQPSDVQLYMMLDTIFEDKEDEEDDIKDKNEGLITIVDKNDDDDANIEDSENEDEDKDKPIQIVT